MNTIRSSEFRKGYAKLSEPTVVTVLGRPIGTYLPGERPLERVRHCACPEEGHYVGCLIGGEVEVNLLTEEVRRLKQELAKRPLVAEGSLGAIAAAQSAAKERLGLTTTRGRQKLIDATLAKVNRKTKAKP